MAAWKVTQSQLEVKCNTRACVRVCVYQGFG